MLARAVSQAKPGMPKTIALIGALDTKGQDFAFVKAEIERRGHRALVINTAVMGEPAFAPDVAAERVAEAGGAPLAALRAKADRGEAMTVMTRGIIVVVKDLFDAGRVDGVLAMGGSAATVIGAAAMRALPVGVPKVMVSTLASGDVKPYVGTKDVVMIHSVVDVAGVNGVSARIYANAAGAVVGMVETPPPAIAEKPLIAASMFGNTTPVVTRCRETFERRGYEVLVFHAVGTGGQTMEDLIRAGYVSGVADITPTEWADELVGGVLTAGPERMDAAPEANLPLVIAPGCLDMVNFWARDTVPEKYSERLFYEWNSNVTLMRTTPEENEELGRILAAKANKSQGPVAFFLPLQGVSMLDAPGKEFWWPAADQALFQAVKRSRRPDIPVYELDLNINDEAFADALADKLLEFLGSTS
jgi:uncharacterized protein (UPF0261 family)